MSDEGWSDPVTCPSCELVASMRYRGDGLWRCEECGVADALPRTGGQRRVKGPARAVPAEADRDRETG